MIAITEADVAAAVRTLPTLPQVVMELIASLGDDDCDIDRVARSIARDPAITAKTLRLANSSFYGLSRQVHSIEQAITILGFSAVRNIASTTGLVAGVSKLGAAAGEADVRAFWRHSLACAVAARELAPLLQASAAVAYTCGLLHDVGKLLLMTRFSAPYAQVLGSPAYLNQPGVAAEQAALGVDHAQLGALMAQQWQLPEDMQDAIACHHRLGSCTSALASTVAAANVLAHGLLATAQEASALHPALSASLWQPLQMSPEDADLLVQRLRGDVAGLELLLV
jgi:putative nucleotidyltransferase with HDIG domain